MTFSRRVHTPLWYDRDDLEQNFNYDESQTQTPDEMATEMVNLVTLGRYSGGTVLHVEKEGTKVAFEGIREPELSQTAGLPETKRVQEILARERGKKE
jgi:endonuclease YncB( thermonuclease family)